MICKKLMTKTFLFGLVLGAILSAAIVSGCTGDTRHGDGQDPDRATVGQDISEREGGGEHGSGGDGGGESGGESSEAAMSSPITPLGQSWNGVLGELAVSMQYDAATRSVHGTVRNTLSRKLCYVQAEPHLKSGTKTVGELGPEKLGHLNPGQEATSSLTVASEPKLAGVSYDGYVVHMEVFDCSGPGPAPHTGGEGTEGSGEHSPGSESGSESAGAGGEEGGGANALAPDETFDAVRSGARTHPEVRRSKQLLQGHRGEHDRRRPRPGQDRSAPFERSGARSDDSDGHGSGGGGNDRPARDAGIVHWVDHTCRGRRRRRGERVWRGVSRWWRAWWREGVWGRTR